MVRIGKSCKIIDRINTFIVKKLSYLIVFLLAFFSCFMSRAALQTTFNGTHIGDGSQLTNLNIAGITNFPVGLATTNFVLTQISATNFANLNTTTNLVYSIGANGTNFGYLIGANGTNFTYFIGANLTNYVNTATNGHVTASITNGLATTAFVYSIGANNTNYVNSATNGHVTASITNGLATTALVYGIGANTTNYVNAVTNGFVKSSITNGLTGNSNNFYGTFSSTAVVNKITTNSIITTNITINSVVVSGITNVPDSPYDITESHYNGTYSWDAAVGSQGAWGKGGTNAFGYTGSSQGGTYVGITFSTNYSIFENSTYVQLQDASAQWGVQSGTTLSGRYFTGLVSPVVFLFQDNATFQSVTFTLSTNYSYTTNFTYITNYFNNVLNGAGIALAAASGNTNLLISNNDPWFTADKNPTLDVSGSVDQALVVKGSFYVTGTLNGNGGGLTNLPIPAGILTNNYTANIVVTNAGVATTISSNSLITKNILASSGFITFQGYSQIGSSAGQSSIAMGVDGSLVGRINLGNSVNGMLIGGDTMGVNGVHYFNTSTWINGPLNATNVTALNGYLAPATTINIVPPANGYAISTANINTNIIVLSGAGISTANGNYYWSSLTNGWTNASTSPFTIVVSTNTLATNAFAAISNTVYTTSRSTNLATYVGPSSGVGLWANGLNPSYTNLSTVPVSSWNYTNGGLMNITFSPDGTNQATPMTLSSNTITINNLSINGVVPSIATLQKGSGIIFSDNIAIGGGGSAAFSGVYNLGVSGSIAIGNSAGNGGGYIPSSIMIGNYACYGSSSWNQSVAIGNRVVENGTGTFSVTIGSEAGRAGTSQSDSVLIGYRAGYANVNAGSAVIIGENAAGQNGAFTTSSTRSVLLGYNAGYNNVSNTNNVDSIIIGANCSVATNNSINIGNTIYGNRTTASVMIPGSISATNGFIQYPRIPTQSDTNYTFDLSTNHSGVFMVTLTTNAMFLPPTNTFPGEHWSFQVYQDAVGSRNIYFTTNSSWRPTIFGQIPSIQTNANAWCADIECVTDKTGTNTVFWITPIQ